MSDLISRADAMSKCKTAENELTDEAERKGLRLARFIIGEMPSADAKWTPCSERLPKIACRCLVTLSNNVVAVGTLHSEGEYEDDFGYIVSWGKRWHLEPASMMIAYPEDSVIAWMPLPKPWKGADDE